jgi:hypothetical protein
MMRDTGQDSSMGVMTEVAKKEGLLRGSVTGIHVRPMPVRITFRARIDLTKDNPGATPLESLQTSKQVIQFVVRDNLQANTVLISFPRIGLGYVIYSPSLHAPSGGVLAAGDV